MPTLSPVTPDGGGLAMATFGKKRKSITYNQGSQIMPTSLLGAPLGFLDLPMALHAYHLTVQGWTLFRSFLSEFKNCGSVSLRRWLRCGAN